MLLPVVTIKESVKVEPSLDHLGIVLAVPDPPTSADIDISLPDVVTAMKLPGIILTEPVNPFNVSTTSIKSFILDILTCEVELLLVESETNTLSFILPVIVGYVYIIDIFFYLSLIHSIFS